MLSKVRRQPSAVRKPALSEAEGDPASAEIAVEADILSTQLPSP